MGEPYLDTLARYAHMGWWTEHASAPSGLGEFTNELAAMPSLHVGWAVWVAWALYGHVRSTPGSRRARVLPAAHDGRGRLHGEPLAARLPRRAPRRGRGDRRRQPDRTRH